MSLWFKEQESQRQYAAEQEKTKKIQAENEAVSAKLKHGWAELDLNKKQFDAEQRLQPVALAYLEARVKLGRPPKDLAELKPYLKREEELLDPLSGKPFGIAWNVECGFGPGAAKAKKMLTWEPEQNPDGGRWTICVPPGAWIKCEYVQEKEFLKLFHEAGMDLPKIPIIPQPRVDEASLPKTPIASQPGVEKQREQPK